MSSRSGAALVIAIVVLAAMLLIGLPFLFTQSGSLSGTRSYSHSRLASMGQDSAQSMGVAAGASAVSYHWQQDGVTTPTGLVLDDWTDLFHDLNGSETNSGLRRVGVNRIEFDTRNHVFALPGERFLQALPAAERDALLQRYPTVVGLSIEDESGKLNPNFIDMRGWSRLLQQAGITDWPDGRTPQTDPAHQQLARTLGALRYELPGGRITSIDQLLFAEPPLTIPGTTTVVPQQRRSLTRTELERLRPYLTLSVPAQARGGLIDLGTVIGVNGARITLDHDQPGSVLAFAETPLLTGINTALVFSDNATGTLTIPAFGEVTTQAPSQLTSTSISGTTITFPTGTIPAGVVIGQPLGFATTGANSGVSTHITGITATTLTVETTLTTSTGEAVTIYPLPRVQVGAAAAIDAPPTLNLHQAEPVVRNSFAPSPLPAASPPAMPTNQPKPALLTDLQSMSLSADALDRPRSLFDLLSPLAVVDTVGSTHVLASQQVADSPYGATGPFDVNGRKVDATDGTTMLLDARASIIHIVTGSLERFPQRGYAVIKGIDAATGQQAQEIIEYTSSNPILPLSATAAAARTEVTLYVRRGLDGKTGRGNGTAKTFRSGTDAGRYDRPNDLHLTALATREQQPLGIASQGVISIASTSTVTDPAGNQTAQEQHRVVAQAVPQETALEARWDKQAAFHALLEQRHGSLMASFPRPYPRVTDLLPQDSLNVDAMGARYAPYSTPSDAEHSVGLRPAVMRTLLSHSHLDHSWALPFAGTTQPTATPTVLRTSTGASPTTADFTSANITPEGLRLDASRVLLYPNPGKTGFLRDSYEQRGTSHPNAGALEPIHGRQFGLWVRPDKAWSAPVILLDAQLPDENVGESLSGVAQDGQPFDARGEVSKGASNLFRLAYEPTAKLLILSLNPGTIQQVNDYGPFTPRELFGIQASEDTLPLRAFAYPAVNPECLGSGGLHPMASAPPSQVQSIQHCTYVGDSFVTGDWHLIQVAFTSNQHGGMSIIVDGLVGRDVTRLASAANPPAMTVPGDHLTLPTLVLRADIANTPTVSDIGAKALYLAEIPLDACARAPDNTIITGASAVHAVLPKRGIIRIADEYISYDDISASGSLLRCVRGRRQRTSASSATDPMTGIAIIPWGGAHQLQAHRAGDLVVPGGFAMRNLGGQWFRGGCTLKNPLPDGDPKHYYQIGAEVDEDTVMGSPAIKLRERTGYQIAQLPDFPAHGFVMLNSQLLYYHRDGAGANELMVFYWNPSDRPDPTDTNVPPRTIPAGWVAGLPAAVTAGADVVLVSIELAGDPTTVNKPYDFYHQDENTTDPLRILPVTSVTSDQQDYQARMVQIYDARQSTNAGDNRGRAEWLAYTSIETRTTFPGAENHGNERRTYLMNIMEITEENVRMIRGGFWFNPDYRTGGRGRQRTAFAASDFKAGSYNPALHRFPAGTRVIPVQTTITSPDAPAADTYPVTYLLEAGDMVTLAPTKIMDPTKDHLLQMCVRYSANDGFPDTKVAMQTLTDPVSWNVMNMFFAFTEAIPADWNLDSQNPQAPRNFHLLSWPCWTPEKDLSPPSMVPPSYALQRLGWLLPWGNAYAPGFNPASNGTDRPLVIGLSSTGGGVDATIDALHSGGTNGWSEDNGRNAQPTELVQANVVRMDANDLWLGEEALIEPLAIQADTGIFAWPYGLVEIGSEVFAYRRRTDVTNHNNAYAYLIGRSMLGSIRRVHIGRELVLHLPIGPVAEVVDALPVNDLGPVQFAGYFAAPAMLLTSRNGDVMELTTMPNSHTAPWLRGMYNTTPVAWVARGAAPTIPNLAPLAIGWWPRYPSALPNNLLTRPEGVSKFLRSRSYSWAGFPLRFHDCQFNTSQSAYVKVISNGDGLFDIQALALDATLDWSAADLLLLLAGNQTPNATSIDASRVFGSERFLTAGDEVISPRLTNPANTPRTVDGAELRVVWTYSAPVTPSSTAPAQWLQVAARNGNRAPMIGPVYLRTRAPNKVLNVER